MGSSKISFSDTNLESESGNDHANHNLVKILKHRELAKQEGSYVLLCEFDNSDQYWLSEKVVSGLSSFALWTYWATQSGHPNPATKCDVPPGKRRAIVGALFNKEEAEGGAEEAWLIDLQVDYGNGNIVEEWEGKVQGDNDAAVLTYHHHWSEMRAQWTNLDNECRQFHVLDQADGTLFMVKLGHRILRILDYEVRPKAAKTPGRSFVTKPKRRSGVVKKPDRAPLSRLWFVVQYVGYSRARSHCLKVTGLELKKLWKDGLEEYMRENNL